MCDRPMYTTHNVNLCPVCSALPPSGPAPMVCAASAVFAAVPPDARPPGVCLSKTATIEARWGLNRWHSLVNCNHGDSSSSRVRRTSAPPHLETPPPPSRRWRRPRGWPSPTCPCPRASCSTGARRAPGSAAHPLPPAGRAAPAWRIVRPVQKRLLIEARRGQHRWRSLMNCSHGDSITSRVRRARPRIHPAGGQQDTCAPQTQPVHLG
jgi:hypothetical protein